MGKISKLFKATAVLGAVVCGAAYYKKKHGMNITDDSDFEDDLSLNVGSSKKVIDFSTEGSDEKSKKVTLTFNTDNAKKVLNDTLDTIGDAMYTAKDKIVETIGEERVDEAKEKANQIKNKLVDTVGEDNINKAKSTLSEVTDKAKEKADDLFSEENIAMAKEKASEAIDKTKETLKKASDKVISIVSDNETDDAAVNTNNFTEKDSNSKDFSNDDFIDDIEEIDSDVFEDDIIDDDIFNENFTDGMDLEQEIDASAPETVITNDSTKEVYGTVSDNISAEPDDTEAFISAEASDDIIDDTISDEINDSIFQSIADTDLEDDSNDKLTIPDDSPLSEVSPDYTELSIDNDNEISDIDNVVSDSLHEDFWSDDKIIKADNNEPEHSEDFEKTSEDDNNFLSSDIFDDSLLDEPVDNSNDDIVLEDLEENLTSDTNNAETTEESNDSSYSHKYSFLADEDDDL